MIQEEDPELRDEMLSITQTKQGCGGDPTLVAVKGEGRRWD